MGYLVLSKECEMVFTPLTVISAVSDPHHKHWFYFWWKRKKKRCCSLESVSETEVTAGFRIRNKTQDSACCLSSVSMGTCTSQVREITAWWLQLQPSKQNTDQMADGSNGLTFLCRTSPCSSCHKSLLDAANPGSLSKGKAGPISSDFLNWGEAMLKRRLRALSGNWALSESPTLLRSEE